MKIKIGLSVLKNVGQTIIQVMLPSVWTGDNLRYKLRWWGRWKMTGMCDTQGEESIGVTVWGAGWQGQQWCH